MGDSYDLDVACYCVGANGKMRTPKDMVYYGNPSGPNGSILITEDDRDGSSSLEGDDEQIMLDLSKVDANVSKIIVAVQIYDAVNRGQTFGGVENAYVCVFTPSKFVMRRDVKLVPGKKLLRYDLGEEFGTATALVACELYRHGKGWKYRSVGKPFKGDFQDLCNLLRPH